MELLTLKWNRKEMVKPSIDHVNDVKKGVRLEMCIGVGIGRKNSKREIMSIQMKVVRK